MHAIKGGWVGQTFALASCNDSGGKKSRIRRSKEERKTMVESFIKKYQTLNNGNFPSLNLTHKEVGGSFYTVRELVREIIQENRVLGPAMFPLEEESKNDIMHNFPVGSIAVQPLICSSLGVSDLLRHMGPNQFPGEKGEHILTPNEHQGLELQSEQELEHHFEDVEGDESCTTELTFDHHQGVKRELLSNSIEQFSPHEHLKIERVDAGGDSTVIKEVGKSDEQVLVSRLSINHEDINQESHDNTISEQVLHNGKRFSVEEHLIQASEKNGDFREPLQINTVVEDSPVALKEQSNELGTSLPGNSLKSEVAVETFPLRPVTQTRKINGMEGRPDKHLDRQNAPEEMESGHEIKNTLENISSVIDVEVGAVLACPTSENVDGSLDEKASPSNGYLSSESSDSLTANETPVADGNNVVITKADVVSIGKLVNVGDLDQKNLQAGTATEVATATKIDPSSMEDISSLNKRPSTLDRTKLETWEGTSEKPSATKTEPLVALFKAFVAALVKFFTE